MCYALPYMYYYLVLMFICMYKLLCFNSLSISLYLFVFSTCAMCSPHVFLLHRSKAANQTDIDKVVKTYTG